MYLDQEGKVLPGPRSVESYAHKAAKAVLVGWLREAAEADNEDRGVNFCGVSWRVNRRGPHYGVWEEYPLINRNGAGTGDFPVWDEWDQEGNWIDRPPTYRECLEMGFPPKVILDVAVQHKGAIVHGFEIVHRHGITPEKRAFLKDARVKVHVVEADWVLRQICVPQILQSIEFFPGSWR